MRIYSLNESRNFLVKEQRSPILRYVGLVLFLAAFSFSLSAQNIIKGKVSARDSAIVGATVQVKGSAVATKTDTDGNFTISAPANGELLITSVGYLSAEISVRNRSYIDVQLESVSQEMNEVIVVGYGTKKKRDITGSISTISEKTIEKSHGESLVQALQGNVSGVYVESNTGQPGGGVSVRVRGMGGLNNSEPLYVVDGVQMTGGTTDSYNTLAAINPNDIKSIEVLKDASSAAIYGARGANGVVIITTKRGQSGSPKLSYSGTYGISNMVNPNNFGVLNAREYAEVANKAVQADGGGIIFGGTNTAQYPVEFFPSPEVLGAGTNWMEKIAHKNAPTQEHQLSISGGNSSHQYYLSLNYLDQAGGIVNTSFKRYSVRLNTDNTINKSLKIGNSLMLSSSKSNGIGASRGGVGGLYFYSMTFAPTISPYNPDGTFAGPPTAFYPPYRSPFASIYSRSTDNSQTTALGNVYADLTILKGLSFRTNVSAVLSLGANDGFVPSYSEGISSNTLSTVNSNTDRGSEWRWSNVLSYFKDLKKHHISALIGQEASENKQNTVKGTSSYNDDAYRVVSSLGSVTSSVNQEITSSSMISYFGNLSYNYDSKYYLEGSVRRDGSSRFGINSRWGVFPSFSAAWRISQESFFPKETINELKLRLSYGKVGNDKIGDFAYLAGLADVLYAFGDVDGSFTNGLAINKIANPDLKWETSTQKSIGIDFGFLRNKLSVTAEYFETKVSDMLLGIQVPAVTGIDNSTSIPVLATILSNVGGLTNKGFEFEASYSDKINKLSYTIGANLTTIHNRVTDIGTNAQLWGGSISGQNLSRTVVGSPMGSFYGYVVEGIFQSKDAVDQANAQARAKTGNAGVFYQSSGTAAGDFKYKDTNGDGVINANDRADLGSPIPKFIYGFNVDLSYNAFGFSMLLMGNQGNKIFNGNNIILEASGLTNSNKSKTVLNSWSESNTNTMIPRRTASDPNSNSKISSAFVEDGSFMSLRNIQLSYSLPTSLLSKIRLTSSKIYVAGENLLILTKYSGRDPQVGNINGNNQSAGIDNDLYPHSKTVRIGLQVNF